MVTRDALVDVAARLLQEEGLEGMTTRAVAQAAGVQAPAIYRLFGDKDGLLDAVAEHVFATYVAEKARTAGDGDPVEALRAGWRTHVAFSLANPALFGLLSDPARAHSPAVAAGAEVLRERVRRVAEAGRLRVSEQRAVALLHAGGSGAISALLAVPAAARDLTLAEAMYDAVAGAILTGGPAPADDDAVAAAVRFRTVVPELHALTRRERALMVEWLDRAVG